MIDLKVLSTPNCQQCDLALKLAIQLQSEFPDLRVEKIDVMEQPQFAVEYGVMAAPTLVINGQVAHVGAVTERELRDKLLQSTKT